MKKRIFVIDDESDLTYMLKLSLESMGYYTVESENDPASAVRAARAFDPDLIVLDIMMPGMDGTEVAARMRQDAALRDVPILFMTALIATPEAPDGFCNSGGQTFVPKAMGTGKLIECIEQALNRRSADEAAAAAELAAAELAMA